VLNFTFNGWDEKYPATLDNQINKAIFNQLSINTYKTIDMVLEDEDTNSHIGTLARFAPTHVLVFNNATINMITTLMRIT